MALNEIGGIGSVIREEQLDVAVAVATAPATEWAQVVTGGVADEIRRSRSHWGIIVELRVFDMGALLLHLDDKP